MAHLFRVHTCTRLVARQTLTKAGKLGMKEFILPPWYDLDREEGLLRLKAELSHLPKTVLAHTRNFLLLNDTRNLKSGNSQ